MSLLHYKLRWHFERLIPKTPCVIHQWYALYMGYWQYFFNDSPAVALKHCISSPSNFDPPAFFFLAYSQHSVKISCYSLFHTSCTNYYAKPAMLFSWWIYVFQKGGFYERDHEDCSVEGGTGVPAIDGLCLLVKNWEWLSSFWHIIL